MLLGEIRDYIKQRGTASLRDISLHFDIGTDSAQFALDYWQRKGKIRVLEENGCGTGACGSCASNSSSAQISYEWVNRNIPLQWHSYPN